MAAVVPARPHPHWPPGLAHHLTLPRTHLWFNVEVSATRYPDKPFLLFYDTPLSFADFKAEAEALAGHLQQVCGVQRGDRVLLQMQNSPQWALAFYAILRADAVVVPVNPMNRSEELRHYVHDSGARVAFVAQDLLDELLPHLGVPEGLQHIVVSTYADHLKQPTDLAVPAIVSAPRAVPERAGVHAWHAVVQAGHAPGPLQGGPDDLCVMPYTSGTTGHPKGCMHTHATVMTTLVGSVQWFSRTQDTVYLGVLPFFHVTGMSGGLNGPMFSGATVVVLPRWDREAVGRCIQRYRVSVWQVISTMMIDFLSQPDVERFDLSSLQAVRGGGAAMPAAIVAKLKALTGLDYVEGYGMSETIAATHINPPHRPKPQCLGIPVFDVDARLIDPGTLAPVAPGEVGEIVIHGPQVMQGYWRAPQANESTFVQIDGKRFLRTGDLARVDDEGYWFMVDRLKRMINAAGFKVWPAEVEALMYQHPAIQEAFVIGTLDERRGETVKALVVLKPAAVGQTTEQDVADWCRQHMAAYKAPKLIEFVESLPKSGTGKVQWRMLQERERGS